MKFTELFVGPKQVSGVGLVLSKDFEDVRVVLLQVVALLIAVHADILDRAVLLDAVKI